MDDLMVHLKECQRVYQKVSQMVDPTVNQKAG